MQFAKSSRQRLIALALCLAIASSGCALLVPPAWRSQIDIPLYGPIDGRDRTRRAVHTASPDPAERQPERQRLSEAVERDRRDLMDLVADPEASDRSPADDPELRATVQRLTEFQSQPQASDPMPAGIASDASVPQ
jgi:hypothetical protein